MFISKTKKSPFYQLTYEVNGKRTTISTKTTNEKEALAFLANFKQAIIEKPKDEEVIIQHPETILLSVFQKEYLEYARATKSPKYVSTISSSFKQLFTFSGDMPLNEINTRLIDKFITSTFSRTKRGSHQYYRTLKAAFNKAITWNYIDNNPFTKIKFPKLSKTFPAFISEDELLVILSNTKHQHLKDIFTIAFYTGLRLGELINMHWSWVDFSQNQITVKCDEDFTTKNKKERVVPMSVKVQAILKSRFNSANHEPKEVVFYRIKKVRLHQETVSQQFKQVARKSNLSEKIHFHTLRHSFASLLAQKGVSLYVIKELLGHEDLTTTQIYSHLQQQNLVEAVSII